MVTLLTVIIASIGSMFSFLSNPLNSICVYFASLTLYPQYMTLSLGVVDFTVSRIVIIFVFANIIFRTKLISLFKWNTIDSFVVIYFVATMISYFQTEYFMDVIERNGGYFFDNILPYFMIRLCIIKKSDLYKIIKIFIFISIPIALLGIVESATGINVYYTLKLQSSWLNELSIIQYSRYGFTRATTSFAVSIAYGMYMILLLNLCVAIRKIECSIKWNNICLLILFMGTISSMSSAPFFALVISIQLFIWYYFRIYTNIFIFFITLICIFIETYSNRHFYEVFTRFAFSSESAYYRVALINEALGGGMNGHWLFGYGFVGVYSVKEGWNWIHRDLCNLYILILARVGLCGLIPFVMLNYNCYRFINIASCKTHLSKDDWFIWFFRNSLIVWNISLFTVGLIDILSTLFFLMIACASNMSKIYEE